MNQPTNPVNPGRKQQGFMLLEALLAILIFSVGILAMVGLQAASIKNNVNAKYRADASYLANQAIANMWVSNTEQLSANFATGGAAYNTWVAAVQDAHTGLPNSSGANAPTITVGAGNFVTITVYWKAPGEPDRHQYVATAQINGNAE